MASPDKNSLMDVSSESSDSLWRLLIAMPPSISGNGLLARLHGVSTANVTASFASPHGARLTTQQSCLYGSTAFSECLPH